MSARHPVTQQAQRGLALVVSLVLLVVVTLLGVSGMQGTGLQERMSGNLYDRSLSMQAAEAALRAAEAAIRNSESGDIGSDCAADSGNLCPTIPADTFTGGAEEDDPWTNATAAFTVNEGIGSGTPQYFIEIVGDGAIDDPLGQSSSYNCLQDGDSCATADVRYYRITARSHNPATVGLENRALVVLQATVQRSL
ncbi:pilus assembly PilX family protein [Pseudazoarcus pumilus]|uniref:Pilus assembly protein n=1 Tax=Pseudazoarcus pumilus TaxID=2067960 RepID=A0A2I6S8B5_9RHOO|nr:PilX N-terminal domain-containing pilus assembly protein [Pseudazoarcus pumilus]AUN95482.1 hypothetical protein C0099_11425 [Pseudazoarcus pumilus]